ncbi:MAG TPA: hypothetical protein VJH24_02605, partial [Candidatus Bilamarchaeaceae archaeon]|nr:hypothetical protein [Candidatus Bilamarchaeaceae archaeon]
GNEGYIGYTLLSPEEFQKTNFYQACGLADSSYDVLDITPSVSWIDYDGMRQVFSGRLWLSGPGGRWYPYLDDLGVSIPPLSVAHGFVKRQEAMCGSGDGDTHGKYWFPRYVLFLKDTANCKMTNSMPKTEAFGWCEGCSYLTMAQQEMLAGDGYRNLEERRYRRSSGSPYSTAIKCLEFPGADGPGCSLEHGDGTTEFIAFDAPLDQEPESLYLLEQQATYLKEGVLPVLDLTDRSNWQEVNGGALAAARRKINNAQTWMEWASGGPGSGGAIAALQELISRMGRGIGDFGYEELIRTLEDIGQRLDSANMELAITSDQLIAAEARLSDDRPAAMGSLAEALPHLSNGANNVTAAYNRMIPICDGLYGESWLGTRIYDPGIWALTPLPDLCNAMEVNIFTNVDEARREIIGELHQVGDGVLPRGPTILIVGEVNESVDEDEVALMKLRASIAKQICGRCLVGIQIDNGPSGSLGGKERFTKDFVAAEKLPNIDPESLNNVDVIAIGVYPHEFVQENSALCGSDELYETVLEELRIFGRHMLSEPVEKFTLVSRMELDRDVEPQCWEDTGGENINEDPVYRLFGTLAVRQRTLTQNGVLGMIYSETDALEETVSGGRTYSDQFCSLEKASRLLVSDPAITVYNQIELQDEVTCQQCEADEISSGACSRTCGNGRQCTMPEDVPVDGEDFYRCPDQGYPGPSIPCSSIEDKNLACQRVYGDGRVEQIRVPMSDLDAGFPDVIASIPYGYRCNVDDETGQYTFTKVDVRGKAGAPIIFSYGSNADEDCGVPDFNLPAPQQCSDTSLPIRDYRIQCQFEDGPPDPWPPPAMLELEIVDGG